MRHPKSSSLSVFFTVALTILVGLSFNLVVEWSWGTGDGPGFPDASFCQLAVAAESPPAVSRWTAPTSKPKQAHPVPPEPGPSQILRISPSLPGAPSRLGDKPTGSAGRIALVVHRDIYDLIADSLGQYEADLAAMGYGVVTQTFSGTPEALRASLFQLYHEPERLVGAVLVGEIPYILFEMNDDFDPPPAAPQYTDFPCDLYFMDLDGEWSDSDGNGKYDTWTGQRNLEIWACRLKVANLTDLNVQSLSSESFQADVLTAYFQRNHSYRVGSTIPLYSGLVYDDDPWLGMVDEDAATLSLVFSASDVDSESTRQLSTKADYLEDKLPARPQIVFLRSHGYSEGHVFDPDPDFVTTGDYRTVDPQSPFFSLYVCSGSDFSVDNNLAGTIAFNPEGFGLLAWGTTKTGGMWSDRRFYEALAAGEVFGEAFRQWYNETALSPPYQSISRKWWGGMVLIGDAALKPLTDASPTGSLTVTLTPPEAAAAGAKWSVDGVTWKNSGDTVAGLCRLGEHTIRFSGAPGWIAPQGEQVSFRDGPSRTVSSLYNPLLGADFSASATMGKVPFRVSFEDNTSEQVPGPKRWHWDFGDGGKSTRQNPVYVYRKPGSYTVTLTVTFADGTSKVGSYTNFITAYAAPRANFLLSPARVRVGQPAAFMDKSTGTVVSRSWSFGPAQSSTEQNPTIVYDTPGPHTVTLTVNGPGGSSSTISRAITVFP